MVTPSFLQPGDSIGIVAPARSISAHELNDAVRLYESWGLKVKYGNNLYKKNNQFAGTDRERAGDFQKMLDDDEIKAIFCARGGYGTVRIMEYLSFEFFVKNPRWIAGFSDITVLHSYINHALKIKTLHTPMPYNITKEIADNPEISRLKEILFGKNHELTWEGTASKPLKNTIKGKLTGGNLSVIYSLRGTPYDIDTTDKILFIEDVDEYLYHIDRMMMNLKAGGKLSNLRALIVGGMTDMNDNRIPYGQNAYEIIRSITDQYNYPVIFDFPAGHSEKNSPLIMGDTVTIKQEQNGLFHMAFNT
ncbi:MAG: LD-carboxypeptidase [Bacteroidales bacterium]